MKIFEYRQTMIIPHSLKDVFSFFSTAENLNKLTPDNLQFKIMTPLPIEMRVGQLIDYKIKLYGIPMRWRTEITKWDPPLIFEDTQISGPYKMWVHQHIFSEHAEGTEMTDYIQYALPFSPIAPLINKMFVRKDINKIFTYRLIKLNQIFPKK